MELISLSDWSVEHSGSYLPLGALSSQSQMCMRSGCVTSLSGPNEANHGPAILQAGDESEPDEATAGSALSEGAQLVAFPGLNAPLPEGADPLAWGCAIQVPHIFPSFLLLCVFAFCAEPYW